MVGLSWDGLWSGYGLGLLRLISYQFVHDLAIGHGRRFDRHKLVQPIAGQHESTRMLGKVPGCSDELMRKLQRQAQAAIAHIEV